MKSFEDFCNQINGKPYKDVPPPVEYNLASMEINRINGIEGGSSHECVPLSHEDMARYASDDVIGHYNLTHNRRDTRSLGDPLTDNQFKKFMGHTW